MSWEYWRSRLGFYLLCFCKRLFVTGHWQTNKKQHKPWWIRNWSYKRTDRRENRYMLNDLRIEGRQEFKSAVGVPEVQILTCATFTHLVQTSLPHWFCGFGDSLSSHTDALRQVHSLFQTEFLRLCELSLGFLLQIPVPASFLSPPSMCLPLLSHFTFLSTVPSTTWFRRQFLSPDVLPMYDISLFFVSM